MSRPFARNTAASSDGRTNFDHRGVPTGSQRSRYSAPTMANAKALAVRFRVAVTITPPGRTRVQQASRKPPALAAHDDVETAVGVLSTAAEPYVAVIDNHQDMKLVGCLNERDAMLFHSRAVAAARKEERGGR